jgi:hypothetical protein
MSGGSLVIGPRATAALISTPLIQAPNPRLQTLFAKSELCIYVVVTIISDSLVGYLQPHRPH